MPSEIERRKYAQSMADGYRTLGAFLRLRMRNNPRAIIEDEAALRARVNADLAEIFDGDAVPIEHIFRDVAVELLMAFREFAETVDLDSPYSAAHQLENRTAFWRSYLDMSSPREDETRERFQQPFGE